MAINFTSSEYKLILWSFDYIRDNFDITTDQLPDILVKFWTVPDFLTRLQCENRGVQIFIFMFIVRMNRWPEEEMEEFIKFSVQSVILLFSGYSCCNILQPGQEYTNTSLSYI